MSSVISIMNDLVQKKIKSDGLQHYNIVVGSDWATGYIRAMQEPLHLLDSCGEEPLGYIDDVPIYYEALAPNDKLYIVNDDGLSTIKENGFLA